MSSVSVSCCQPPASSIAQRRHTPAVPLKLKKAAAARARAVLHDEVAVEQDRFDFGQRGVVAVQVGPARLDHARFWDRRNTAACGAENPATGRKSASKMATNSPVADFEPRGQRAGLVAGAVVAMQIVDRQTERLVALDARARDLLRLVGRIVEHLNVEQFARIIEARDRVHQALDHVALVVDGKLYGNLGPLGDRQAAGRERSGDS